jgi:hypothetical protein
MCDVIYGRPIRLIEASNEMFKVAVEYSPFRQPKLFETLIGSYCLSFEVIPPLQFFLW